SQLPQKEIRKTQLAAGADEEVGVGEPSRIEIGAETLGRHLCQCNCPACHVLRDAARCASNLVAGAVVEGDGEIERGIVLGKIDGVVDQPENIGLEPGARSNHADLHPVLMQIGEVASDEAAQQAKQVVDLLFRTCPVLRRKAEQSEMSDAKLDASLDRAPDALDALAMTFGARQPTLCGPAAIAVHDDRDMAN